MDIPNLHFSSIANLRKVRNEALWKTEHDGCCETYFIKCFLMECALLHILNALGAGSGREMSGASFLTNSPFHVWHTNVWFSWQSQKTSASIFPFGINGNPWSRKWQPTPVFLPGKTPWTEKPGGLQSMGSQTVRYDWPTKHSTGHYDPTSWVGGQKRREYFHVLVFMYQCANMRVYIQTS